MRLFLCTTLIALTVFSGTVVFAANNSPEVQALNDEIAEKRKRIEQIEKSISEYKKKAQQKKAESVSLSNQIGILTNHLTEVELDIEATSEKLETISLEIEALDLGIAEKELMIKNQQGVIAELVRNIYIHGNRNVIQILATYNTFSDFYNEQQQLETIERDLGSSVKSLQATRGELEEKKESKEERKTSYEDLKVRLADRQQDLSEQSYVKQDLLTSAQSSELKFRTLVDSLKKQYQAIESEISSIERSVRAKLNAQNQLEEVDDEPSTLSWPTQSRYITALFHDPDYPYRHVFEHNAIDIRAAHGTPLKAAASGYIGRARRCTTWRCYSYTMIIHSGGLSTVYGHMSSITVADGQFVTRGDVIGYSGGTPRTVGAGPFVTGPHLHFEVRKNGIPVNPLNYLP